MRRQGLALLLVVGVLGILSVLALAFVTLARLERRASLQRLHATQALLLARSGLEDAFARLSAGQEASYGGEDWDASGGSLSAFEAPQEVFQPGTLNAGDCPARHAMRPSFFARIQPSPNPALQIVDGRQRGYTGLLGALQAGYALKVEDLNGRIHVNGGDVSSVSTLNDGPNGFLWRLLNNLDEVVTGTSNLGSQVLGSRPPGGYRRLEDLKPVLGQARYDLFKAHLTVHAWVDPKVARPQPMEARPQRWMDVDDTHRSGVAGTSLAGTIPSWAVGGSGTETSPWSQTLVNTDGDLVSYPVRWQRDFVYAWRQLRLGPVVLEPRAPVALNEASREVLAATLLGLKGTHLEVWDGSAGYDGGFGWYQGKWTYPYPDQATEDAPWHRTRADYGMPYGPLPVPVTGTDGNPRTWYGPSGYDPTFTSGTLGGRPVVVNAPLGRLRESQAISRAQALAVADEIRSRIAQKGLFRAWAEFNAFVDQLPRWEDFDTDADKDGVTDPVPVLDGPTYAVTATTNFGRHRYEREDANSDGVMNRQVFTLASGSWAAGPPVWVDLGTAALSPGEVPGLGSVQKDVIRAMANPNTDLNDFNPDANLFKEVDKTDLAGIQNAPSSFVHTTEFSLDPMGHALVESVGRILDPGGRLQAQRALGLAARIWSIHRDTSQGDFMKDYLGGVPVGSVFSGPATSGYTLAGNQTLMSYPETQALGPSAAYDGQIGLGWTGVVQASPADERMRGDLFGTADATGVNPLHVADVRGPSLLPLTGTAEPGNLFPDGVYSEKDASLKYPLLLNFEVPTAPSSLTWAFYVGFWVKPNWFPEASPRPHALLSLSSANFWKAPGGGTRSAWNIPVGRVPVEGIPLDPAGLYFVPARNCPSQSTISPYVHGGAAKDSSRWPSRSLLWGTIHGFFMSENLNRRGILNAADTWNASPSNPLPAVAKPVGRLEGHRWTHLAVMGETTRQASKRTVHIVAGRLLASPDGGGWNLGFQNTGLTPPCQSVNLDHAALFGPAEPNHIRFGEIAAAHNLNYVADATYASLQVGGKQISTGSDSTAAYLGFFKGAGSPAALGRYYKEGGPGAVYSAPKLPALIASPLRITWTEVPCDLWFDGVPPSVADGWMGDNLTGTSNDYIPLNDRFGPGGSATRDGLRDVRVDLEVWETDGAGYDVKRAKFNDPAGLNVLPVPAPANRLYYKAVFVNDWGVDGSGDVRANNPLDVTPYLDDVTVFYRPPGGIEILAWEDVDA